MMSFKAILLSAAVVYVAAMPGDDDDSAAAPCNMQTSEPSCDNTKDDDGKECVWCTAGAVPPACFSQSQAARLPPAVFQCDDANKAAPEFLTVIPQKPKLSLIPDFVEANKLKFVGEDDCHFENPFAEGKCRADEVGPITIEGIDGAMCAPECTDSPCPTNTCQGMATPQCALESPEGQKFCALICSPDVKPSNLRAGDSECGDKASCKPIQGVGICTYDE